MDLRKLKSLIDLVSESNISELEITEAEGKIRIVKSEPSAQQAHTVYMQAPAVPATPAMPPAVATAAPPTAAEPSAETGHVVKSPMVGTFYRAPSPGAKPFVEIGDSIKEGQPICIIEAMKIMNEIEAEVSGVVREICVEDATPVEYGQVLFRVDPNG